MRSIVVAVAAALVLIASHAIADANVRDIRFSERNGVCDHDMDTSTVTLHNNKRKTKKRKKDVLVWQVMNDCASPQTLKICVSSALLEPCVSLPAGLKADVNSPFQVTRGQPVSLFCRGAEVDKAMWSTVGLAVGGGSCPIFPADHKIDIEVVP
jgi:hypothetical protein